jgi:hypothetical protein
MADFNVIFQDRMEALFLKLMAAVEVGVVAAVSTGQATGGAAGQAVGGAAEGVQGGSGQNVQTGFSHKNDVSVPELTESYNLSMLSDTAYINKVNARTFDIVSGALNLAMLGSGANLHQQQANVTGHADEEFSARKRATVISLVTVGDAVEEGADDSDRKEP